MSHDWKGSVVTLTVKDSNGNIVYVRNDYLDTDTVLDLLLDLFERFDPTKHTFTVAPIQEEA